MRKYDLYSPRRGDPATYLNNQLGAMSEVDFYMIEENLCRRQAALHTILGTNCTRDVFAAYLAMYYFDKFLPKHGTLLSNENNMSGEIAFFAKTCLSIAIKVRLGGLESIKSSRVKQSQWLSPAQRLVVAGLAENLSLITPLAFASQQSLLLHEDLPVSATIMIIETQDGN